LSLDDEGHLGGQLLPLCYQLIPFSSIGEIAPSPRLLPPAGVSSGSQPALRRAGAKAPANCPHGVCWRGPGGGSGHARWRWRNFIVPTPLIV
jgi:hypothetical protein